ncbi:MAG TPA: alpha/beta hydrolase [Pseudolysinimonas sp.]|nr:alpha/beta hydrolase [Pseudolysinimonas sp.]
MVIAILVVVAVVVAGGIVARSTPWPSALIIRSVFNQGGAQTVAEMNRHQSSVPLTEHLGVQYSDGSAGGNTTLDAFSPAAGTDPLPVVVWIHGGAWISGDRTNVDPYLRILAAHGYAAVSLNYTIAPEAVYPTAVRQLNEALGYLQEHAAELRIDPDRVVLAGDSAGAQLASELATLTTNPEYAHLLGISPALSPSQLVGTVLNCGVYDLSTMADLTGVAAWGFKIALWAYTGTQNWSASYQGTTMSTIDFVTKDFPPTYISGGNGDGLTWIESVPMSNRLKGLGVDVTSVFYSADHEPSLPHEYQFHLDGSDARSALQKTLDFLAVVTTR